MQELVNDFYFFILLSDDFARMKKRKSYFNGFLFWFTRDQSQFSWEKNGKVKERILDRLKDFVKKASRI